MEEHYYLSPERRAIGQDIVARQGLRHVGFAAFVAYLGVCYGDLLPLPLWTEGRMAKLTALAFAVGLYWLVGWWRYGRYGATPNTVPRSARELGSWAAAVAMMGTALIGSDGLVLAIVSLLAAVSGLAVMMWIVFADLLGRRKPVHWLALWLLIICAAILQGSSPTEQSVAVGLLGMSIGLTVGIVIDHRRFVRSFELRTEEA